MCAEAEKRITPEHSLLAVTQPNEPDFRFKVCLSMIGQCDRSLGVTDVSVPLSGLSVGLSLTAVDMSVTVLLKYKFLTVSCK